MEHRHGTRKTINIPTTAELSTGKVYTGYIKDISLGGIFIELPSGELWSHAPITLAFTIQDGDKSKTYRWRGFITRIAEDGAGAMFESANPYEQAGLLALLKLADRNELQRSVAC